MINCVVHIFFKTVCCGVSSRQQYIVYYYYYYYYYESPITITVTMSGTKALCSYIWRMDPGSACLKAHIATEVYIIHECDSDKHLQYTSKIDLYVYKLLYNTCVHMKGVVGSLRCRSLRTREGLGFESWQWGTL